MFYFLSRLFFLQEWITPNDNVIVSMYHCSICYLIVGVSITVATTCWPRCQRHNKRFNGSTCAYTCTCRICTFIQSSHPEYQVGQYFVAVNYRMLIVSNFKLLQRRIHQRNNDDLSWGGFIALYSKYSFYCQWMQYSN